MLSSMIQMSPFVPSISLSFLSSSPFHAGICTHPMQVVRTGRNNLNNRFLPFESIQTDAVFSLDDDQEAPHSAIEFAFRSAPNSHSQ